MTEYIGFTAALCTSISFLPQAIKVIKTKDTESLSLLMYVVFVFGVAMWLMYGLLLSDLPMILANSITLALASIILMMKVINEIKKKRITPV